MITRREAVTGGVLAGVGTAMGAGEAGAQDSATDIIVARVLALVRDELQAWRQQDASARMPTTPLIAKIRQGQRQFLRGNSKYPDFIEVGADVWDDLVDWHVTVRRQAEITVRADGRYTMPFLHTHIVLRLDFADDQVSPGFDTRVGG